MAVNTKASAEKVPEPVTPTAPAQDKEEFCVYLGPPIRGVLQHGQIFTCTRRKAKNQLADVIAKHPKVASLLISNLTLVHDRVKAKTPGNALYNTYQQLRTELIKAESMKGAS